MVFHQQWWLCNGVYIDSEVKTVVYIFFYIVSILQTAKEEFLCTEIHISIVHVTITTLNLEFDGRNIDVFFLVTHTVFICPKQRGYLTVH